LVVGARGDGHRTIARKLGRAPGTVGEWLCVSRRDAGSIQLRAEALLRSVEPTSPALGPWVPSAGSPLADAADTLGHAIGAVIRRFGPRQSGDLRVGGHPHRRDHRTADTERSLARSRLHAAFALTTLPPGHDSHLARLHRFRLHSDRLHDQPPAA